MCVNTEGSYECTCYDGYEIYNQTHCQGKKLSIRKDGYIAVAKGD